MPVLSQRGGDKNQESGMTKRVKCKNCTKYVGVICQHLKRKRSSGKKRDCVWFSGKAPKGKITARYVRYMSNSEKRKERERLKLEIAKRKELQKVLEQEKLLNTARVNESRDLGAKSKIKKQGAVGKLLNRFFKRKTCS